ncbi:MAG: DUF123 domain-containing protein [Candidatus Geothermarchaeales archaeon]
MSVYALILELPDDVEVWVGSLGRLHLRGGFYAYIGSALTGLEARIRRHLREEKTKRWHIDYLEPQKFVRAVAIGRTRERMECQVVEELKGGFEAVKGFGSSDCGCESHLFYSESFKRLREGIAEAFIKSHLEPEFLEHKSSF